MAEKKILLTGFLTCLAGTSLAKPKNAVMTAKKKRFPAQNKEIV